MNHNENECEYLVKCISKSGNSTSKSRFISDRPDLKLGERVILIDYLRSGEIVGIMKNERLITVMFDDNVNIMRRIVE